jgi:hypothetical protein
MHARTLVYGRKIAQISKEREMGKAAGGVHSALLPGFDYVKGIALILV